MSNLAKSLISPGSSNKDGNGLLTSPAGKPAQSVDISNGDMESQQAPSTKQSRPSLGLVMWLVLATAFGIVGLITGAWSVSEVRRINNNMNPLTDTVVIPNARQVPNGYTLVMNLFRGTGYWGKRADMLYDRSDMGVVGYKGDAYIFGGLSNDPASGEALVRNNLVKYDAIANSSTELKVMPVAWSRFGYAVWGDKLYVFAGVNATDLFNMQPSTLEYDFLTNEWTTHPVSMSQARTDVCSDAIDGKIYSVGGYGLNAIEDGRWIEVFDTTTKQWSIVPAKISVGRGDCKAVAMNGLLYIMGGTEFVPPPGVDCIKEFWKCYQFSKMVEVFNPRDNSITRLRDMNYPRGDFGAVEFGTQGHILVAGGEYNDVSANVTRLLAQPWVEMYSVKDDYWTPKAPLPEPRFRFGMAKAGDQVMAFGGHPSCAVEMAPKSEDLCNENGLRSVYVYDDVEYPSAFLAMRNDVVNQ